MVSGIDVSHFQRDIDWPAAAASGIGFCFIKATEGMRTVDPRFHTNRQSAKNAGLLCGAYHFFHPISPAAAQADLFLRTVGQLEPGELPPALDLEAPDTWAGIAPRERANLALAWLETVEHRLGVTPIVYLSPAFAIEVLDSAAALARFPIWFAHHTDAEAPQIAAPWHSWTFWQYSASGQTAGVTLPVVLDRFNGSLDDLKKLTVATP